MTAEFEALIKQHSGRIRRIAMRYAESNEVEDLLQEILLALWRSLPSFRGESRMETWVYRVSLNTALSGVRKRITARRRDKHLQGLYHEAASPGSLPERDILTEFLDALNELDASVMMMTLDGMSPKDIEEVIGISANAISVRINRIKQRYIDTYVE